MDFHFQKFHKSSHLNFAKKEKKFLLLQKYLYPFLPDNLIINKTKLNPNKLILILTFKIQKRGNKRWNSSEYFDFFYRVIVNSKMLQQNHLLNASKKKFHKQRRENFNEKNNYQENNCNSLEAFRPLFIETW